jgi:hypothetical protein
VRRAPRDSAPAVLEQHHWRVVRRCADAAGASHAHSIAVAADTHHGLPVWTVDSLRAASQAHDQEQQEQQRMYRAGCRAQRAGLQWQHHAALLTVCKPAPTQPTGLPLVASQQPTGLPLTLRDLRQRMASLPVLEHSEQGQHLARCCNAPNRAPDLHHATATGAEQT